MWSADRLARESEALRARLAAKPVQRVCRPRREPPHRNYAAWARERCPNCKGGGTLLDGAACLCVAQHIARRAAARYRACPPCAWRIEFGWCMRRVGVPAEWAAVRLRGEPRPAGWWHGGGKHRICKWDAALGRALLAAGLSVPHV